MVRSNLILLLNALPRDQLVEIYCNRAIDVTIVLILLQSRTEESEL
jgi:hypothetical protein